MSTTRVTRHMRASRPAIYQALLDAEAVTFWMVPDGMTSRVHAFDPNEGGRFRISLTYDTPSAVGKTESQTDTFHGRFVVLKRDTQVSQIVEFETTDPALQGEMRITYTLADAAGGGTDVVGLHEDLPPGVRVEDNELGWRMSLDKLARHVEALA